MNVSGTEFQEEVDPVDELTSAILKDDSTSAILRSSYYGYDRAGNRTSEQIDSTVTTAAFNSYQMANTYQWDAAGRLVKASYTGGSTEYSYDCLGRRVKIVEKNGGGTVTDTKQFVFDGMAIAEQRDGVNTVTKRYFADGWRDIGGGANYFYTKDHLGSVREVTDDEGAMVARYDYDPYGRTTKLSGSVDSDMLYTGHYHDAGSGLYLTMFRAYSPNLARWISRDPIGEAGGINLYQYVANNPINLWDPYGLVNWAAASSALAGAAGNGLGVVGGAALGVGTSWSGVGGIAGAIIAGKSLYGLGANLANLYQALVDEDPVSNGSLLNDAASLVFPCNDTAQGLATALDLTIDLGGSRIAKGAQTLSQADELGNILLEGGTTLGNTFVGNGDKAVEALGVFKLYNPCKIKLYQHHNAFEA